MTGFYKAFSCQMVCLFDVEDQFLNGELFCIFHLTLKLFKTWNNL